MKRGLLIGIALGVLLCFGALAWFLMNLQIYFPW